MLARLLESSRSDHTGAKSLGVVRLGQDSVYFTTVITAVFPGFYATYAAAGLEPAQATARFGLITTVSVLAVAIMSPVLGVLADSAAYARSSSRCS